MKNEVIYKILLIEDSEEFRDLVCHALGPNFNIVLATHIERASVHLQENQFDLILLDIGLPDGDGLHFFSLLLKHPQHRSIPVIFLTANNEISSKVLGISLGADDYIVKPIEPKEFRARIEMRAAKYYSQQKAEHLLYKGDLEINLNSQRACIFSNHKKIDLQLTPLEFKFLSILSTYEDRVFHRDDMLKKVWGSETHLTTRCVDAHIYSLRKKLGHYAECIQTVYGEGYRFSLSFLKNQQYS